MKTLIAPTEDFIKLERGFIGVDVTAGSNVTIALESNNGLSENDFIVIGKEGSEKAEMAQINAAVTEGTDIQVDTLIFDHKEGEPITLYRYNKRKFYGAESENGTYTELTSDGSPADIQVDDPQGTLLEYTGSTYTYFKSTYYNSETLDETDIDSAEAVLADESKRYTTLYAIRVQAGLTENPYINDGRIERKRKQAENEINSSLFNRYTLPLDEVPPLIQHICELLAAGYLDFEEYGPEGQGVKWLGEARGILKSIKSGAQRLIGSDGTELSRRSTTGRLQGFPNATGEDDSTLAERSFKIDQTF